MLEQFRFCGASLSLQAFQNVTEQPNDERKELAGMMCTRCREKHRKCDRQLPGCNRCARAKLPCVYPKRSVQLSGASLDTIASQVTYLESSLQALEAEYYQTLMKTPSQIPPGVMIIDNSSDNADDKSKAVDWLMQHRSSTISKTASNRGDKEGFQDFSAVFIAQDPRTRREHNYSLRIAQTPSGFRIMHNFASTATFLQYLMYTLRREPAPPLQQYYEDMVQSEHQLEISQDDFREILSVLVFNVRPMWKYSGAIGATYRGWSNETSLYTSGSLYLNLEGYEDSKDDESVDEAGQMQRRRISVSSILPELQRETDRRQQPRMRLLAVPENELVIISHLVTQYAECVGSLSVHIPSLMRRFWAGKLAPIVVNSICAMYALHTYVTHGANLLEMLQHNDKGPDKIHQSIELGRRVEQHFILKTRDLLDDAFDEPHIDTVLALFNLCVCFVKYQKPNRHLDPAASEVPPDPSDTSTSAGTSGQNSHHTDKARTYFSMAVSMIRSLTNYDSRGRMVEIRLENKNDAFERESARRILWALIAMDATLNTDPNGTAQWTLMDDCCNDRIRIPGPKVMPDEGEESAMGIAWVVRQFSHEGFVVHRRIAIDLFHRIPQAEGGIWGTEITQTIEVVLQELDEWFNNRPQVLRRWPNRTFETQQCLIHLVQTDLDVLMKKLVVLRGYFGEYGEDLRPNKYRDEASTNLKSYQNGVYSDPSTTPSSTPDLSPYTSSLSDFPNTPSGPMRDKSMERHEESFDASFQKHPFGEAAAPYTGSHIHPPSHHQNSHQPKTDEAAENARLHARYIDVAIQTCLDVAERFGEVISNLACFKSSLIFSMVQCVDILVRYMELVHQVTERQQLHKLSGVYKFTPEVTPSPVLTQITFPLLLSLTNGQPIVFNKIKHNDKPRGVATALRVIADNFRSLRISPLFGVAIDPVLEKINCVLAVPLPFMALASVTKDKVEVEVKIESDDEPMFWRVKSSISPDTVTKLQSPPPDTEATSPTEHVATSESTPSRYLESLMMQDSWEPTICLDTDVDVNLLPNLDDLGI